jgi:capsular polysaccharide biosynthesis protein
MSPVVYLRAARKHWLTIAAATALGMLVVSAGLWQQGTRYRAGVSVRVTFGVDPQRLSAPDIRQLQQRIVKTYAQMANEGSVTAPIIQALNLPYSTRELGGRVHALSPVNGDTIDISVEDSDPQRARDVGNAIAARLVTIAGAARPAANSDLTPKVEVTSWAMLPQAPVRVWWQLRVLAGLVGGLTLGVGLATFRHVLELRGDTVPAWLTSRWSILTAAIRAFGKRGRLRLRGM